MNLYEFLEKQDRLSNKMNRMQNILRNYDLNRYNNLSTDIHWYMENHKAEYDQSAALAEQIKAFVAYNQRERTAHAERFAEILGISSRSLYRYAQTYLEASAWAIKLEKETGRNYEHLTVLSLCRKPREGNTFPTLPPELRAYIENGWFDEKFRANRGTRRLLYKSLSKACKESGIEIPSYAMVTRYINHLRDKPGAASAEFLAEKGVREWKNKFMMKGDRDHTLLDIMVEGESIEAPVKLSATYGLRRSETLGIRWSAVDWERKKVIICHTVVRKGKKVISDDTVKETASFRAMPLTKDMEAYLRKLQTRQEQMKELFGNGYQDNDYICKWDYGKPLNPDYVTGRFKRFLEAIAVLYLMLYGNGRNLMEVEK